MKTSKIEFFFPKKWSVKRMNLWRNAHPLPIDYTLYGISINFKQRRAEVEVRIVGGGQ